MTEQCHVKDGRIQQFDNDPSYLDGSAPIVLIFLSYPKPTFLLEPMFWGG